MKSEINRLLHEKNLDAIVISGSGSHNAPLKYFTKDAFFTHAQIVIIRDQDPVLFYRPMERDNAERTGFKKICYDSFPQKDFYTISKGNSNLANALELQSMFRSLGFIKGRAAFCGQLEFGTHLAMLQEFQRLMPEIEIAGSEGIEILNQARFTKDESELAAIRKMGEIVVKIAGRVEQYIQSNYLKNGILVDQNELPVTIGMIKKSINMWLTELGAENPNGTIFSMGRDAGVPHNEGNDDAVIEAGKSIVFDFFPCETGGGYFYDFTRTWCIGYASQEIEKAYEQVRFVHDAVLKDICPGKSLKELQHLTCRLFREMGHQTIEDHPGTQEGYVHSVSHGLGLNVHERPFSGISASDADVILPGTVFTVEPGLYYPEIKNPFGVRIEDTIYIDNDGNAQYFVQYPYHLVIPVKQLEK
jgi:Xaa-Pro aminopeptidase